MMLASWTSASPISVVEIAGVEVSLAALLSMDEVEAMLA